MKTENLYSGVEEYDSRPSRRDKALAWVAHLFTATGAIWGLLAILAITDSRWIEAFIWMGLAVFVDAFDGIAARRVRVKEVLPGFDGALLDNILDYLNYVFVPAYFLVKTAFLPEALKVAGASLILDPAAVTLVAGAPLLLEHHGLLYVHSRPSALAQCGHRRRVGSAGVRAHQIRLSLARGNATRADDGARRHVGPGQHFPAGATSLAQPMADCGIAALRRLLRGVEPLCHLADKRRVPPSIGRLIKKIKTPPESAPQDLGPNLDRSRLICGRCYWR